MSGSLIFSPVNLSPNYVHGWNEYSLVSDLILYQKMNWNLVLFSNTTGIWMHVYQLMYGFSTLHIIFIWHLYSIRTKEHDCQNFYCSFQTLNIYNNNNLIFFFSFVIWSAHMSAHMFYLQKYYMDFDNIWHLESVQKI